MSIATPDIVSGIQPNAHLHIGNYFGAISNWVSLQHSYSCIYMVVDLHAMTSVERKGLRENTGQTVIDLLACGVDLEKSTLLIQSLVPEHTFMLWVLSCFCSSGDLLRMPQVQEPTDGSGFNSAGLLNYPVLQAADILAYKARYVPVGADQEQHLELARSIARRFNATYGCEFFPEPQPLFTATPRIKSLTDPTRKMGNDGAGQVGLFEAEESIRKKVRAAKTDSGHLEDGTIGPGVENLIEILRACGQRPTAHELEQECRARGSRQYDKLKDCTADALVQLTARLKEQRNVLMNKQEQVFSLIREKSAQASQIARQTVCETCRCVGLPDNIYSI